MYTVTISNANNLLSTKEATYQQVLGLLMQTYSKPMAYELTLAIDTTGSYNYSITTVDQGTINTLIKRH